MKAMGEKKAKIVKLCQLINMIYNSAERKKKPRDRSSRENT